MALEIDEDGAGNVLRRRLDRKTRSCCRPFFEDALLVDPVLGADSLLLAVSIRRAHWGRVQRHGNMIVFGAEHGHRLSELD